MLKRLVSGPGKNRAEPVRGGTELDEFWRIQDVGRSVCVCVWVWVLYFDFTEKSAWQGSAYVRESTCERTFDRHCGVCVCPSSSLNV